MKRGFTLMELMIVVAIISVVASIAIPGLLAAQRAANERSAVASLRTVKTAEADFRSNDRDGNRQQDYWTADIFGLYGLQPLQGVAAVGDSADASRIIQLIEPSLAAADGSSDIEEYDNVNFADSIGTGSPKASYVFLKFDHQQVGASMTELQIDTDGPTTGFGEVYDWGRYAFMAAPVSLSGGKFLFIVNADQTIWKYPLPDTYTITYTPMADMTDSATSVTGTGQLFFEDAMMFPHAPGSAGCSKLD